MTTARGPREDRENGVGIMKSLDQEGLRFVSANEN
jgi:hypothetical protein